MSLPTVLKTSLTLSRCSNLAWAPRSTRKLGGRAEWPAMGVLSLGQELRRPAGTIPATAALFQITKFLQNKGHLQGELEDETERVF